jgi:glutathione peroxidase
MAATAPRAAARSPAALLQQELDARSSVGSGGRQHRLGSKRGPHDVTLRDIPVSTLTGQPCSLADPGLAGKTLLIVNVASKCGLTPQYAGLEALHQRYADRGFSVVGFPCNQFGGQEPGSPVEIAEFCSTTYGVSFPMFEKIEVNGDGRHPIYADLTATADADGAAGDVQWNFEKFLVGPDSAVLGRFRPLTTPDAAELVAAIEASLPR